ncbi:Inner membrane protein YgaP-like transmembrane domain-containing protein OS=Stutzerimonas stutzeri OX=316 GN=CXK95_10230 PE=4 SV=1 [Stutzerimonas stutzeri]
MNSPYESRDQNVHGWERAASLAGGLLLLGRGARRGGAGGLLQAATGALVLLRGISGRCEAKRLLSAAPVQRQPAKARYSHMPLDSEVHSPDFENAGVSLPDATPMGHERSTSRS